MKRGKSILVVFSILILAVSINAYAQVSTEPQAIDAPAVQATESASAAASSGRTTTRPANQKASTVETAGASGSAAPVSRTAVSQRGRNAESSSTVASQTQGTAPSTSRRGRNIASSSAVASPAQETTPSTSRRGRSGEATGSSRTSRRQYESSYGGRSNYGGGGAYGGGYNNQHYGAPRQPSSMTTPAESAGMKIYKLQHAQAHQISTILTDMHLSNSLRIIPDNRTNSIIVSGPEEQFEKLDRILQELDVPLDPDAPSSGMSGYGMMGGMGMGMGSMGMGGMGGMMGGMGMGGPIPQTERTNVAYRVFAVEAPIEIPAGHVNMRQFDLALTCSSEQRILVDADSIDVGGLIIDSFQINEGDMDKRHTTDIRLSGFTESSDCIKRMINQFDRQFETECVLENLRIGSSMHTGMDQYGGDYMPAIGSSNQPLNVTALNTHVQLPGHLGNTVKKLLNNDIKTVGYWFGNSALPGECMAPIGQWQLSLDSQSNGDSSFLLNIDLSQGDQSILSNSVNARIDRPIIIGYTRIQSGVLCPGALVVIPQREFD